MNHRIARIFLLALFFAGASFAAPKMGTMTDSRDGKKYKTVKIGEQVWMAENLNYETAGSICYENDSSCIKYGRLYTWTDAMNNEKGCNYSEREKCGDVQGVCPDGWHLPKDSEWSELHDYVMMKWGNKSWGFGVPKALLVKSSEAPDGTNVSGFSANLHDPGFCANCFPFIRFWTTIELYRDVVFTWKLRDSGFSGEEKRMEEYAVVRCLKNSP